MISCDDWLDSGKHHCAKNTKEYIRIETDCFRCQFQAFSWVEAGMKGRDGVGEGGGGEGAGGVDPMDGGC